MNEYLTYRLALKNGMKTTEKKKKGKIAQFSKKRQRANREYAEKSRPYWVGKQCAIKAPGCWGMAQCINHKKGKSSIKLLLDEKYWEASCFWCNNLIEKKHQWAIENNHKVMRNGKHIR